MRPGGDVFSWAWGTRGPLWVQALLRATWDSKDAKTLTGPSAGWPRPSRPPRAPARGIKSCRTQRREARPRAAQHPAGSPASQKQRLGHVRLDSATQHLQLPFPSTFQKYRSHTARARVAEKTSGSAARRPAQAAPAPPEIPPSPVASARDPISLRCPAHLHQPPRRATTGAERHQGWQGRGDADHPLPGPQPASSHLPPPLARQQESGSECQCPWALGWGPGDAGEPHTPQRRPGKHSLGAQVTPGWWQQPHRAQPEGDTEPTQRGLWVSGLLTSCPLAPAAPAPPWAGTGCTFRDSRGRCPTQSRAAPGACATGKRLPKKHLSDAYLVPRAVLRPSPA